MIEPVLSDEAFLADVASVRGRAGVHLWWLGQSGFLVHEDGHFALLDPYLSDSLTAKYAQTDKPHIRMTRRVVDPARLDFVEVVTSTHNHTDHLDAETLRPLLTAKPKLRIIVPAANLEFAARRLEVHPSKLDDVADDEGVYAGGFAFDAVPAAHPTREFDEHGRDRYLGYLVRAGALTIYHSGDTVVYDYMVERLRGEGPIDLAILPINGKVGNMGGRDAARLAKDIGARLVIPCHYEMFEFNTADPRDEFVPECERLGQPYKVLRAGERLTLGA